MQADRFSFRHAILCMGIACLALFTSGCLSYPGPYKGYQTRAYHVRGQTYQPISVEDALDYEDVGVCSWFNESKYLGLIRGDTSCGEKVMPWHLIAAHKTLPLPSQVRVTNLKNGRSIKVRVNDRGPFIEGRLFDVSPKAAKKLGFYEQGVTQVRLEVLSVGDGKYRKKKRKLWF